MAITWEHSTQVGGNNLIVTVTEYDNGAPTERQYSVTLNKNRSEADFKAELKSIINADRVNRVDTGGDSFDFSAFETYLNT